MLKAQRQDHILQHLYQAGKATVPELCTLLNSSPATIRRDLEQLAAQELVKRTHGGIVLPDAARLEAPVIQRRYFQTEEKRQIGKAAAALIQDEETVFLGSGSTVLAVAENLTGKKKLTVITNSLPVINLLGTAPNITTVMTGGFLRQPELSLIGHLVETSLSELRADKVVMSIQGIHRQHGLTNSDIAETLTDRAICQFSPKIILVADYTKFQKIKASFVANISAITTLVTDRSAPPDFLADLEKMGIEVIIA